MKSWEKYSNKSSTIQLIRKVPDEWGRGYRSNTSPEWWFLHEKSFDNLDYFKKGEESFDANEAEAERLIANNLIVPYELTSYQSGLNQCSRISEATLEKYWTLVK